MRLNKLVIALVALFWCCTLVGQPVQKDKTEAAVNESINMDDSGHGGGTG